MAFAQSVAAHAWNVALLEKTNELEIMNVTERHALRLDEHTANGEEDLDRYVWELESAASYRPRLRQAKESAQRKLVRDPSPGDDPDAHAERLSLPATKAEPLL